jgi:prephenate dehydratase/chorismate mutase/prephenate dehydratase
MCAEILEPEPEPAPAPQRTLERLRVAFQGEFGAFGEEAIHLLWRGQAEPIPKATFEDVMSAAEMHEVDYGMLPIESTLVGGLDVAYDLLSLHDGLKIVAEVVVPVHLCLLAVPGATIKSIRTLSSHPVILGQCSHFLGRHKQIKPVPAWDTAGAAREVRDAADRTRAAAGTRRAAERFELAVLMEHIEDRPDSQMRFLAVARDPANIADRTPARTALLAVFPHEAGALVAALGPMAEANFNISHLASRPTREPWRYQFFMEFEHIAGDPHVADALQAIREATSEFRLLGTYPRWMSMTDQSSSPF